LRWREFDGQTECRFKNLGDFLRTFQASAFSPAVAPKMGTSISAQYPILRPKLRQTFSSSALLAVGGTAERALEVFSIVDADQSGSIDAQELEELLRMLDIEASAEDAGALFKYLDAEQNGEISFEEFEPWYADATSQAQSDAFVVQDALLKRKSVDEFDQTPVDDGVLRRAIECAIASPSIGGRLTEHWRFIQVGDETVKKIAELEAVEATAKEWVNVPGRIVVTTELTPYDPVAEMEDFAATCCAIQNFMLSMWSEGVGTKWASGPVTRLPEFADLCGVDTSQERVVGCIWFGFARGGLASVEKTPRTKGIDDVLTIVD